VKLSEGRVRVTVTVELLDPETKQPFASATTIGQRAIYNPAMGAPLVPWQVSVEAEHVVDEGSLGEFVALNAERLFGGKP